MEWLAYYQIEPFGERPEYLRAGIIASTIANVNRRRRSRTYKPEDFMPPEPKIARKQTTEEMKAVMEKIYEHAQRHGLTRKDQ